MDGEDRGACSRFRSLLSLKSLRLQPVRGGSESCHKDIASELFMRDSTNLDLLRSVAVLAVLAYHLLKHMLSADAYQAVWGLGRFGVLAFFVHTSLVLMFSLERMQFRSESLFAGYYIRRAFRIYPLSIFWIVVVLLTGYGDVHPARFLDLAANFGLFQNLVFSPSAVGPMWSLPYEIQMYVFLPFLYLFALRYRSVWAIFGIWGIAVVGGCLQPAISARADLLKFTPCFLAGVIAYQLQKRKRLQLPAFCWVILVLGCVFLYIAAVNLRWDMRVIFGWPICLLLGCAIPQFAEIPQGRFAGLCNMVAKYSYGIYLTQELVLKVALDELRNYGPLVQIVVLIVMMVGIPVAAYHCLEQPFIRLGVRIASRFCRSPKVSQLA